MFLRNAWHIAGYSDDLEPGQHIGRKFLGESVVIFRTQAGILSALEDRCSHRAMPLSAGHVDGEIIRCFYHGVEFNAAGGCARIPNQDRIPKQASIRPYPIVEKDAIMWIWMGNPAEADPETILANPEHVDPRWTWEHHYMHVESNWQLLVDNILDLTHLAYVHSGTVGGNVEQHFAARTEVQFDGNKVKLIRHMPNSIPPATYVRANGFEGRVDRWQEVEFEPRKGIMLRVNAGACDANTGAYEGKRDHGFMFANIHGITPETETTTHYMWSICTNAPVETGAPAILFEQILKTIREDEVVLAKQQARISETPDRPFVGIASDGALNQGRRLLNALHEAEHQKVVAAE